MTLFNKNDESTRATSTNRSFQIDARTKNFTGKTLLSNQNVTNVNETFTEEVQVH